MRIKNPLCHAMHYSFTASLACVLLTTGSLAQAAGDVVISQAYGGGGNTGATWTNDFVELFNRSSNSVSLSGMCLQYFSATGTSATTTNLSGSIPAGGYFLVQMAAGTGGTQSLPTADLTGTTAMASGAGKLALLNSSCSTALSTSEAVIGGRVVDYVGYGATASRYEGAAATATLSNTTAAIRASNGCQDTDVNSADFSALTPVPRNSATATNLCAVTNAAVVPSCPSSLAVTAGVAATQALTASDADGIVSAAQISASSSSDISLSAFTAAGATGGHASTTLNLASTLAAGSHSVTVLFSNADATPQTASCTIAITVANAAGSVRIRDIQGASHVSPLNSQTVVNVPGIVTAVASDGFYFQDNSPDADVATSEGVFVYTAATPTVSAGDSVLVSGTVSEYRPGGTSTDNLTTTEIITPSIVIESSGNTLPAVTIIGSSGRVPPAQVIDNDATGSVESSGTFDASSDGIDFYESLEGMRVQMNNVVAVGPTNSYGEIAVIGDNGINAGLRTPRGGLIIRSSDYNPERVILDDDLITTPSVNVGDTAGSVTGVMDYYFGNFKLELTSVPVFTSNGLAAEVASAASSNQLTIASFNVENLSPNDTAAKFAALASQIINNLLAPDVIAVMEMQDNNGSTNDSVVDASTTFSTLISAIQNAGGPTYQYRQINPEDDQDGGEPGGNIRVGFLYNATRVTFIDRAGGSSTSPISVVSGTYGPELSASPGRIYPGNSAFTDSRKPLVGEFQFNGHKLFVIANHFNSKGGDEPLMGHWQPPVRSSEIQRTAQASVLAGFVQGLRSVDASANIVVLGDLNDFQFSDTLTILKNAGLVDLVETLNESERYTYVYDGNSQALDHIMISDALSSLALPEYDVVHVNSEFASQTSDHEPELVKLLLPRIDVTNKLSTQRSGLVLNRSTNTFNGTVTLTNSSSQSIKGPLQLMFNNLPSGVTLANASGSLNGVPYITVSAASLAAGASTQVSVRFSNPARVSVSYSTQVYSGQL